MFAQDTGWLRRIREAIGTGLSAEAAVRRVQEETRVRIGHASDPYLRERLIDLDDIANRLLRLLVGKTRSHDPAQLPSDTILIARNLGAADLLEYERGKLRGIVVEEGSRTAHVTIVARAIGIPMLGRIEGAMAAIDTGDPVARWRQRAALHPPQRRDPAGLPQGDPRAGGAQALFRSYPHSALGDPGRHRGLAVDQCRIPDRSGRAQGGRCRGLRPVPHRARVHDPQPLPGCCRTGGTLPGSARHGRRPAGQLPHARRRQRQAPALSADAAGGQSGHGLAGHPHGARPADPAAGPVAGIAAGRIGPASPGHVPDGGRGGRAGRRPAPAGHGDRAARAAGFELPAPSRSAPWSRCHPSTGS